MPNTFGGEWHRPGSNGKDRQRGHSKGQLAYSAHYDNEPQTSCLGCVLFALSIIAAIAAALGAALS